MKSLLILIEKIENGGAFVAALTLALMFFLGLAEIIMRSFFEASIPISLEYTGYLVAFSFFLGLGWTLSQEKHIHLSLIESKLGPEGIRALDLWATLLGLVIATVLTIALITWAVGSYEKGTVSFFPSATPLWIPQSIFAIGPLILSFSLLGRLIRLKPEDSRQ